MNRFTPLPARPAPSSCRARLPSAGSSLSQHRPPPQGPHPPAAARAPGSLSPISQPGPGLHLSRLGLPHTGRILLGSPCPEPSQSRLSSLMPRPALGGEGRGSGPRDPRQPSPAPLPTFPLGALPHPFSLFTGSYPLPFLSILPLFPSGLKRHTPFLPVQGRGAWNRGCRGGWAGQGGVPRGPA